MLTEVREGLKEEHFRKGGDRLFWAKEPSSFGEFPSQRFLATHAAGPGAGD